MKKISAGSVNKNLVLSLLYFTYLFLIWSFYRMNFKFSDAAEEVFIKPFIWLFPFLYIIPRAKIKISQFGITFKNLFPAIYLSLALGVGFAFLGLIGNLAKYGGFHFEANIGPLFMGSSILISFATAITEELVFRGYILVSLMSKYKESISILLTTVLWTLIHAPISYFVWNINGLQLAVYLGLTFIYGIGASVLFVRTKNIAAPIFLHVLWEWPVILFR